MLKNSVSLINSPLGTVNEARPTDIQLELSDLQVDPFLFTRQEKLLPR